MIFTEPSEDNEDMKGNTKTIILYVVLIAALILASLSLLNSKSGAEGISYGEVVEMFHDNKVTECTISSSNLLTIKTTEIGENGEAKTYQLRLRDLTMFLNDVDPYIDAHWHCNKFRRSRRLPLFPICNWVLRLSVAEKRSSLRFDSHDRAT